MVLSEFNRQFSRTAKLRRTTIQHARHYPGAGPILVPKSGLPVARWNTYVGVRPQSWDSGKGLFLVCWTKKELVSEALCKACTQPSFDNNNTLRHHGSRRWWSFRVRGGGFSSPQGSLWSLWTYGISQELEGFRYCMLRLLGWSALWLQPGCFLWCSYHDFFQDS